MKSAQYSNPLKRALNSTYLLLLLYSCILPFVFAFVRPLSHLDPAHTIPTSYGSLISKLSRFLHAPVNPPIVLLGSSLLLSPAVRCDDAMEGREPRYDQEYGWHIQDYGQARYFEQLLSERTGQNSQIANLAVSGALVSDVYLIIKQAVAAGKRPKLIIYGIAPRDFMTRELPSVTSTPVYELFGDLGCLSDLVRHHVSYSEIAQFGLRAIWHFYSGHNGYRAVLINWICSATGHPPYLAKAAGSGISIAFDQTNTDKSDRSLKTMHSTTRADTGPASVHLLKSGVTNKSQLLSSRNQKHGMIKHNTNQNRLRDLDLYRRRYNPPNLELFAIETSYFEELLRFCQHSQIPIVIVNMPLTMVNKSLLPSGILDRYNNMISYITRKHRTQLIDVEKRVSFCISDFEDSCHLNASGGDKLYKSLVEILLADPVLSCYLKNPLDDRKYHTDIGMSDHPIRYH